MKSKAVKPILWVIALALVASCGGGGGGSDTPAPPAAPANLSQSSIDSNTALNITNAVVDIYNQNVAGRVQSAYNGVTVNCPNGGTVRITGLASANSAGLTTVNLTYTMTNCRETRTTTNFVYTGVMTHTGSFNLTTSFVSENIQSSGSVTMVGTITISGFNTANVNQTTTFTINRTSLNDANGNIGGRAFTY